MPNKKQPDIPIGMEKARGRFERWRSSHTGRKPIRNRYGRWRRK